MKAPDSMGLEVLVREGTNLVIHPDQVRQWKNAGLEIEREFLKLQDAHKEKYMGLLSPVLRESCQTQVAGASGASAPDAIVEAEPEEDPEPPQPENSSAETFESLQKLEESDKVAAKVPSAVAGVEILLTEGKNVYLLSEKAKVIPRHSVLGGFGAGKFLDVFEC